MKALEDKILAEGMLLPGGVLNVGKFLNQQIDTVFLKEMGAEIARLFRDSGATKILTVEASGIAVAVAAGMAMDLPVIFAIDRAGLVGEDGETHQGVFDLSYLSTIPNLTVMAPKNKWELSDMLKFAVAQGTPCAIRYPRGEAYDGLREYREKIALGQAEVIFEESGILLYAIGSMVKTAEEVHARLAELGIPSSLVNARFVTPDEALLDRMLPAHSLLVTMEENVFSGGFGEHVIACAQRNDWKCDILPVAVPDRFIEHGAPAKLKEKYGIDAEHIAAKILERTGRA